MLPVLPKEFIVDNTITETRELTFGEKAVGLSFNPSGNHFVDDLKHQYAAVIDMLNSAREHTNDPETVRLFSIAITEAQTAQMWAVKAATWRS